MFPKRSRILVDPKVQWAIGRRVMLHWFLFAICLVSVNMMMETISMLSEESFSAAVWSAASGQSSIIVVMAVMLPMFVLDTMKLTNRFAGPMHRLRQAILKLPSGDPIKPLSFRSGDFWSDVANDFNRLTRQHEAIRTRNQQLEIEIRELRRLSEQRDVAAV